MNMGIKIKRRTVLLALVSIFVLSANAQSSLVFYHNQDQFNSSDCNPAFLNSQKDFTFSIFPLSGVSVGYNNQKIVNEMLRKILRGDSIENAMEDVFNSLSKEGLFYQRFESSLLSFGYSNSNIGSFNFRIKEVEQLINNFKGNFSEFITDPTFRTLAINQPQSFPVNAIYYREYSLGYAREMIKDKLFVGARVKVYFGKAAALSEVEGMLTKDNENTFYLNTKGAVKLSFPINIELNAQTIPSGATLTDDFTAANFLLNSKNIGTGIDFGINYKINHLMSISLSVVDLGKINWKNNLNTIHYKGKYEFPFDYIDAVKGNILTKKPNFSTDSLQLFDMFKSDIGEESFSTQMPVNIYFGLQYQLNPKIIAGVVDRYIRLKGLSHHSISFSASYDVRKDITMTSGYSIIGNSFVNLPLAFLYKWNSGQSYIGFDNVLSMLFPSFSEFSGITFGTCFYLFRDKTKDTKQLEYLPFYQPKKTKHITKKYQHRKEDTRFD